MDSQLLPKAYEPEAVERDWQAEWARTDAFRANATSDKPGFSIVIPPPNVTGVLHLGHVLNNTMQDILCRRARMQGREVLWLPGTDHAGIATQTMVERHLRKTSGQTRHQAGREAFLRAVWEWKEKHGGIIVDQLKRLGCSCDWSRERFTMDEGYSRQVLEAFVALYEEGLIYRGKRMVNWCPKSLTALSDEEVIMKQQSSFLYTMRYEVVEKPGTFLSIATTRPETLMGDTAVAVHPADPRYSGLIGMHCWRPFPRAEIPIVGDEAIDKEFGTGVLKVTPAHDMADFEIGRRHALPAIEVLNPDGTMNELAGPGFEGMDRFAAREKAAEMLEELGLLEKKEPYQNNVGFSERADVPIEPRLSEQWFLRYPCASQALEASRSGAVRFHPERWSRTFEHWMENLQDWCISRQLWWGHRIPAWYHKETGEVRVGVEPPADSENYTQDPDVLDTWFSSWLWPFATMDQPTREKFYPTSVLSTGFDIIFFWVARMIMAGYRFTGKAPFSDVVIHNLIRDAQGRKLSKTLGNSPDPGDLIRKYGADGLRFGLIRIAPQGQDIRFDEKQMEEGRNFANKLWNAARFRQMHGPCDASPDLKAHSLSPESVAILVKLDQAQAAVEEALRAYRFEVAAAELYAFFWGDYCDWYVEASKPSISGPDEESKASCLAVMDTVLSAFLRLLHPFMPHITSELWRRLGFEGVEADSLCIAPLPAGESLPHVPARDREYVLQQTNALYESAKLIRNLRAEVGVASNLEVPMLLVPSEHWNPASSATLSALVKAQSITAVGEVPEGTPFVLAPIGTACLQVEGLVDIEAQRARLSGELRKVVSEIEKAGAKLSNEKFLANAPQAVVDEHRARLRGWTEKKASLEHSLASLR